MRGPDCREFSVPHPKFQTPNLIRPTALYSSSKLRNSAKTANAKWRIIFLMCKHFSAAARSRALHAKVWLLCESLSAQTPLRGLPSSDITFDHYVTQGRGAEFWIGWRLTLIARKDCKFRNVVTQGSCKWLEWNLFPPEISRERGPGIQVHVYFANFV